MQLLIIHLLKAETNVKMQGKSSQQRVLTPPPVRREELLCNHSLSAQPHRTDPTSPIPVPLHHNTKPTPQGVPEHPASHLLWLCPTPSRSLLSFPAPHICPSVLWGSVYLQPTTLRPQPLL